LAYLRLFCSIFPAVFFCAFHPNYLPLSYKRQAFSVLSGGISLADVEVITTDMSIRISKLFGTLYYWRKIPDFKDAGRTNHSRTSLTIYGLELTIYNRSWATDLVETVIKMFQEHKTTEEVGEYLKSLYPAPEHYQLSMAYRMLLPLSFHVYAATFVFGNPTLPAFCVFRAESMSGAYTYLPRKSPEHSLRSSLTADMYTLVFKYVPQAFVETPGFATSMRNIAARAFEGRPIFRAENLELEVLVDSWGMYILSWDYEDPVAVTQKPELIINMRFLGESMFEYSSFTDKLRIAFVNFYAPFCYTDPIFYDQPNARIKYWDVNLFFPNGTTFVLPFVTEENRSEAVTIKATDGAMRLLIPNYVASAAENQMLLTGSIIGITWSTSLPDTGVVFEAARMDIVWTSIYPDRWNDMTTQTYTVELADVIWLIHPYHLDCFAQFGTDWASWDPFRVEPYNVGNFWPYRYFITLTMQPVVFRLFLDWDPPYEFIANPDAYSRADVECGSMVFKMTSPMLVYNEEQKGITYTVSISQARVSFVHPDGHVRQIRRGIRFYDFLAMESMEMSGAYRWCTDPKGDVQVPMTMRIHNVDGLCTVWTIQWLIAVLSNYTSRPRIHPAVWGDPPYEPKLDWMSHSSITVSIDHGAIKVPIDLYDPRVCVTATVSCFQIALESWHPHFHVLVSLDAGVVTMPCDGSAAQRFFNENCLGGEQPQEGKLAVENIRGGMRSVSSFVPGTGYVEMVSQVNFELERANATISIPQIEHILEFSWSFIAGEEWDERKRQTDE
jgi:hypothetical protein